MSDEGFLSRWSRRKVQAKEGVPPEPEPAAPVAPPPAERPAPVAETPPPVVATPEIPPPTMDDVAALDHESDYTRFLSPQVDESVQRAAMKKLFSDPHFNVMDGLDTYIDDYSKPDPIPESMLRRMTQSHFLGLFEPVHPEVSKDEKRDEEERQSPEPKATPDGEAPGAVPQSTEEHPAVPPDEDPDLRLQQDDAAGPGGTGEGPPA